MRAWLCRCVCARGCVGVGACVRGCVGVCVRGCVGVCGCVCSCVGVCGVVGLYRPL